MRRKLSTLVPVIILVGWLILLRPIFLYGDTSYVIVAGRSMQPTLNSGDLAVLKSVEGYSVGDILGYVSPYGPIVIHRIVDVKEDAFVLKGDNHTSVDPWPVAQDMVLGKLVLSIPHVGAVFSFLRHPFRLAAAIAALFFLSAVPFSEKKRNPKFRARNTGFRWLTKKNIVLGVLVVLLVVSAYTVFYFYRLPTEGSRFVELYRYEHMGTFNYSVEVKPNILYNKTTIGPGETIYLTLAKTMDVHFNYAFNCTRAADVSGNYSVHMDVELPEEWTRRSTVVSEVPFSSDGFSFTHKLNITSISELISEIQEQTGALASAYNVKITLEIQVDAMVEGDHVEEAFSPTMVVTFTRTKLTVEDLKHAQPKIIGRTKVEATFWDILGIPILVTHLKYLSYAALAASSAAVVWAGYYTIAEPKTAAERIKKKYGDLIVDSEPLTESEERTIVKVKSIEDLKKVSEKTFKPIIHETTTIKKGKAKRHTLYVLDADIKYELVVEEPTEPSTKQTKNS